MSNRLTSGLSALLLLAASALPAAAQVPMSPRALGMGGAYLGAARGYEALFQNPANLGLSNTPYWSIAFPQVAAGSTLLGLKLTDLPDLAQTTDLAQSRRDELLALVPASGTEVQYDVRAPLAVVQVGHFAVGVGYASIGEHSIGKDIVDLFLNGYQQGRTDYAVGNTVGSRKTFWDFAAGYGRRIGPLSLGATAHYIKGGSAVSSRMFEPQVDIAAQDIEVNYVSVISRGGSGYSLDVGAALEPVPGVTVSGGVRNLAANMKWSESLRVRDLVLNSADISGNNFWDLKQRYEDTEAPLDPNAAPLSELQTAEGIYDQGIFPPIAQLGVDWAPTTATHLDAAYSSRLSSDGVLAGRWDTMLGLGVEQKIPLLTLRAGYATNLDQGSMLTAGLSLGPVQLGVARLDDGKVESADRSGWIASFGLGIRTRGAIP